MKKVLAYRERIWPAPVIAIAIILINTRFAWFDLFTAGAILLAGFLIYFSVIIANEWTRVVILRFGKFKAVKGPGLFFIIPFVDQPFFTSLQTQVWDVEPQEIMTKDSAPVEVDAVVFYHITDPEKAIVKVVDYREAGVKFSQTTLRDIIGQSSLDALLSKKEELGNKIRERLDKDTDVWGIKIESVEIKDVILPKMLKRAMAKEAEAVREKTARLIKAEAEEEAAEKFKKAAEIMSKHPQAVILRQLQTFQEIGAEQNSLILVVPSDMTNMSSVAGLSAAIPTILAESKKAKNEKNDTKM